MLRRIITLRTPQGSSSLSFPYISAPSDCQSPGEAVLLSVCAECPELWGARLEPLGATTRNSRRQPALFADNLDTLLMGLPCTSEINESLTADRR